MLLAFIVESFDQQKWTTLNYVASILLKLPFSLLADRHTDIYDTYVILCVYTVRILVAEW
jgi:hypothetical protein